MNGDGSISISSGGEKAPRKRKERASKSNVWDYFDKIDSETRTKTVRGRQVDEVTVKCKYCGKKFEHTNSDGTSRLWNHYKRGCPNLKLKERTDAGCALPNRNVDDTRKHDILLAKAMLRHGNSYDMGSHSFFHQYVQSLCPGYKLPSSKTLEKLFNEIYEDEKYKLYQVFKGLSSRVSLAVSKQEPYEYATAFFIDNSWNWKKKIIEPFFSVECIWKDLLESQQLLYTITMNDENIGLVLNLRSEASSLDDEANILENDYFKSLDDHLYSALSSESCYFRIKCAIQVINEAAEKGISFYADLHKKFFSNEKHDTLSWQHAFSRLCSVSDNDLNEKERNLARVLEHCWSCFSHASQMLNNCNGVRSGEFFLDFCEMQLFLLKPSDHMDDRIEDMVQQMKSVLDEYWSSHKTLLSIMCFLDPRFKMQGVELCYNQIFQNDGERELEKFTVVIKKTMELYAHMEGSSDSSSLHSSIEDELDSYMRREFEDDDDYNYQVLQWWKQNNGKFKILGRVAKDILGIPLISTAKARTVENFIKRHNCMNGTLNQEEKIQIDFIDLNSSKALCLRDWLENENEG